MRKVAKMTLIVRADARALRRFDDDRMNIIAEEVVQYARDRVNDMCHLEGEVQVDVDCDFRW